MLPKGTNLAYNVCELRVGEDGALELIVDKDVSGEFDATDGQIAGGCNLYTRGFYFTFVLSFLQQNISDTPVYCQLLSLNQK